MSARPRLPRLSLLLVVVVVAVLPTAALAQGSSPGLPGEERAPINAVCPVTTDEPIDPRFTVEYEGVAVGLCCRKCLTKFKADPAAYFAVSPGYSSVSFESAPEQDSDHEHADEHDDANADAPEGDDHVNEGAQGHAHKDASESGLDTAEVDGHDHSRDHGQSRSKLAAWVGKLHPPATHLPIGLLLGAAIAEAILILTRRDVFRHASAFCVTVGVVGVVAAATLGWINGGFTLIDDDWVQTAHRWLGSSVMALGLIAFALLLRCSRPSPDPRSRAAYRFALFLSAGLVGVTGFFGGALVYGINHYAW